MPPDASPVVKPDRRPIRDRLAAFYSDHEVLRIMVSPQEALGGSTPIDLITAGRAEAVHALIDAIEASFTQTEGAIHGPHSPTP